MTISFHLRNETPDISRERQSLQNFRLKKPPRIKWKILKTRGIPNLIQPHGIRKRR